MSENVWDLSVRISQGGNIVRSLTIAISGQKKIHDLKVAIFRSTKIRLNDMRISLGDTPLEDNSTLIESNVTADSVVVCNVTGSVGELGRRQEGEWMLKVRIQHNQMAATKPLAVHPDKTIGDIKQLIFQQYKLGAEIQAIHGAPDSETPLEDDVHLRDVGVADGGMIYCKIIKAPPSSSKKQTRRERRHSRAQSITNRVVNVAASAKAIFEDLRARGEVYIGDRTVIGPGVNLNAEKGPIRIGADCIISDNVQIINKSGEELVIGNYCMFEPAAKIEATRIGHYNIFGAKCHVMQGVIVGSGCVIGPRVQVIQKTKVKDCYVVFGMNMMQENQEIRLRNATYIRQMGAALNKKFEQQKDARGAQRGAGSGARRGGDSSSRERGHRSRAHRRPDEARSERSDRSRGERSAAGDRRARRPDAERSSESGRSSRGAVRSPEDFKARAAERASKRASDSVSAASAAPSGASAASAGGGASRVEEIRARMRQRQLERERQQQQQG